VLLLVGSACQADVRVTVNVGPAGDGTVVVALSLDHEAVARLGDVGRQLRIGDLRRAGWKVTGPVQAAAGAQTVTLSKPFRDPAGAATLFTQLTGPTGPLHGLRVQRHRTFGTTRTALIGTIDLRAGVDAFADQALAQQLGLTSLSATLAQLRQSGAADVGFRLEVAAALPGGVGAAPGARVTRGTAVWQVAMGTSVAINASASRRNGTNLVLAGICVASLIGLAAIGVRRTLGPRLGPGLGRPGRRDRWEVGGAGLAGLGGRRRGRKGSHHPARRDTWRVAERRGRTR
jgi:hypothetical protein